VNAIMEPMETIAQNSCSVLDARILHEPPYTMKNAWKNPKNVMEGAMPTTAQTNAKFVKRDCIPTN